MIGSESCEHNYTGDAQTDTSIHTAAFLLNFWCFFHLFIYFCILITDQRVEFLCSPEENVSILSLFILAFIYSTYFCLIGPFPMSMFALDKRFWLFFYLYVFVIVWMSHPCVLFIRFKQKNSLFFSKEERNFFHKMDGIFC